MGVGFCQQSSPTKAISKRFASLLLRSFPRDLTGQRLVDDRGMVWGLVSCLSNRFGFCLDDSLCHGTVFFFFKTKAKPTGCWMVKTCENPLNGFSSLG